MVGFRILKGGRSFIWPFIERVQRMSLEVLTIGMDMPSVRTSDGQMLAVSGVSETRIGGDDLSIAKAASSLLSKKPEEIAEIVRNVIEGRIDAVIAGMTADVAMADRVGIAEKARESAGLELGEMGIQIVSLSVRQVNAK
jgi:flotillin